MPVVEDLYNSQGCMGGWRDVWRRAKTVAKPFVVPSPKQAAVQLLNPLTPLKIIPPIPGVKTPTPGNIALQLLKPKIAPVVRRAIRKTAPVLTRTLTRATPGVVRRAVTRVAPLAAPITRAAPRLINRGGVTTMLNTRLVPTQAPPGAPTGTPGRSKAEQHQYLIDNLNLWAAQSTETYNQISDPAEAAAYRAEVLNVAKNTLPDNFLTYMDQDVANDFVATFLPDQNGQPNIDAASLALNNGAEISARNMGYAIMAIVGTGAVIWGISAAAKAASKKRA